MALNGEEYRKPITEHRGNPTCDSEWRRVQETYHWVHRKPNLWLWMEKSTGNLSLSTQETQPVALNGEEYRKPITGYTGNPTCDSEWRRVKETYHWAYRKPNLWLWMEKSTGNLSLSTQETQPVSLVKEYSRKPNLCSEETVVVVYLHQFFLCFFYLFHFNGYLILYLMRQSFKSTVVNRALTSLHGGSSSLEIRFMLSDSPFSEWHCGLTMWIGHDPL